MTARVEVAACEAQPVVSIPRDHEVAARRYASVATRALADGMPGLAAGYRLLAEAARYGGGRPSTADVDRESTVELDGRREG